MNLMVINKIAYYSIGYCRSTTNVPTDKGQNRNAQAWADDLGISKKSFLRSVKELTELKLLKVHKGSLYRADGGSYPDYYSITFDKEVQIKHNLYFNVNGVVDKQTTKKSSKPEPILLLPLPDVTGFVQINRTIYDLANVDDPEFYSRKANNTHPTPYDLWKHLGKDKYAEPSSQTLSN